MGIDNPAPVEAPSGFGAGEPATFTVTTRDGDGSKLSGDFSGAEDATEAAPYGHGIFTHAVYGGV